MKVSSCCGANFHYPDYPDNDICTKCGEHASPMEALMDMPDLIKESEKWREKIKFNNKEESE